LDAETLQELFAEFGPVSIRRMFGGMGVFADGVMIALVSRGAIYLKADAETIPVFEQEGQAPFSYATKNGEHTLTSYWRMPDRLYDDGEELARWAPRCACGRVAQGGGQAATTPRRARASFRRACASSGQAREESPLTL